MTKLFNPAMGAKARSALLWALGVFTALGTVEGWSGRHWFHVVEVTATAALGGVAGVTHFTPIGNGPAPAEPLIVPPPVAWGDTSDGGE